LDANLSATLIQRFSCLHDKRNTFPPLVVHVEHDASIRGLVASFRDRFVVEVARLTIRSNVLAENAAISAKRAYMSVHRTKQLSALQPKHSLAPH
jgi:hypothetical protein